MLQNAFIDKVEQPTDADVAEALGPAKALWDQLLADLAHECDLTTQEWNSYSRKAGWSLRLKRQTRNILYLSPCRGSFRVSFALGDRAVEAARHCGLPRPVIRTIDEAKRYAEGTAVRIDVKGHKDIAAVKKLTTVKLEN
ncbi:MAG: DUF3788 domain-containing protein [Acidobacteriia bacterium]|nr:DUF3788 domain-containing protein [Terriglobia bacterium]